MQQAKKRKWAMGSSPRKCHKAMAGKGINVQIIHAGRIARNSERKESILHLSNEFLSLANLGRCRWHKAHALTKELGATGDSPRLSVDPSTASGTIDSQQAVPEKYQSKERDHDAERK